LPCLDKNVAAC